MPELNSLKSIKSIKYHDTPQEKLSETVRL